MKDQFQDKAEEMKQQAKKKMGENRDEASELSSQQREPGRPDRERGQQGREPGRPDRERGQQDREPGRPDTERARQEAQDRFDQDYDI
ncbi:hypothetical protein ACIP79_20670 [Streptomyces sp. NPDC088747]|uniref:hypothetical protein n=1 Tax=Streptomyces sp. NPDC088747 TaxID=3365886 RepID=UPI003824C9A0